MDKTNIYEQSRNVPENAQKSITAGRLKGKTDINPMWRIKKLTELFGPVGFGWRFDPPVYEEKPGAKGEVIVHCSTALYIRLDDGQEWSAPIPGVGGSMLIALERDGLRTDDDAYKKAYTDAQSVACKALGIGADVYWNADATKYTAPPPRQPAPPPVCACCGKQITEIRPKDGKPPVTVQQAADRSFKKYGRILCLECARKQPKEDGEMTRA